MAEEKVVQLVFTKSDHGQWKAEVSNEIDDVAEDYKHIGPLTGEALLRAQTDLVYMLAHHDFVQQMRDKLEKAGDIVQSLANFVLDKESIRLRRHGLKTLSLEEICNLTDMTHEAQWRAQPSYLGALTMEHHYRVHAAISLMPSDEEPD